MRNKQDNEYGMLHPVPGTKEGFVANVCVGVLAMSPFPGHPLSVSRVYDFRESGLYWVVSTPLGRSRMWLPQYLWPVCSVAHLAYLLDFFWTSGVWLSPFVLLDLSLKHKGMITSCLELAFHRKGVFRAPLTPASLQN